MARPVPDRVAAVLVRRQDEAAGLPPQTVAGLFLCTATTAGTTYLVAHGGPSPAWPNSRARDDRNRTELVDRNNLVASEIGKSETECTCDPPFHHDRRLVLGMRGNNDTISSRGFTDTVYTNRHHETNRSDAGPLLKCEISHTCRRSKSIQNGAVHATIDTRAIMWYIRCE